MLKHEQLLEYKMSFLKLQLSKIANARDEAAGAAEKQSQQARRLESSIRLLQNES